MTTKNKDMKWVVLGFIAVSLLVFGSIVVEKNIVDMIYLTCVLVYFVRYIFKSEKLKIISVNGMIFLVII